MIKKIDEEEKRPQWIEDRIAGIDIKKMFLGEERWYSDGKNISETDITTYAEIQNRPIADYFSRDSDIARNVTRVGNSMDPKNPQQSFETNNFNVNMNSLKNIIGDTRYGSWYDNSPSSPKTNYQKEIENSGTSKKEPDMPKPEPDLPKPEPESKAKQMIKGADNLGSALSEKVEDRTPLDFLESTVDLASTIKDIRDGDDDKKNKYFKRGRG
tara:strand:- start:13 stop:651 length:639 start_codon:yes stop_codon:yes gene_type:complete